MNGLKLDFSNYWCYHNSYKVKTVNVPLPISSVVKNL